MSRPRILITLDTGISRRRGVPFADLRLKEAYVSAVLKAGGAPLMVAPTEDPEVITSLLEVMQGLVVTGGHFDIAPELYGEAERSQRVDDKKPGRTHFEWALMQGALAAGRPVFGVCGGMQLLNVVLGGTLIQDIAEAVPEALEHEQDSSPAGPDHPVHPVVGTALFTLGQQRRSLEVNSTHHQAIDRLGEGLEVWGRAPDGVVEAIGLKSNPHVFGVQWHPELLDDPLSDALYRHLLQGTAE